MQLDDRPFSPTLLALGHRNGIEKLGPLADRRIHPNEPDMQGFPWGEIAIVGQEADKQLKMLQSHREVTSGRTKLVGAFPADADLQQVAAKLMRSRGGKAPARNALMLFMPGTYTQKLPVFRNFKGRITIAAINISNISRVDNRVIFEHKSSLFFENLHSANVVGCDFRKGARISFSGQNGNGRIHSCDIADVEGDAFKWGMPPVKGYWWDDEQPDLYTDDDGFPVGIDRDRFGRKHDACFDSVARHCGRAGVEHPLYHSGSWSQMEVSNCLLYAPKASHACKIVAQSAIVTGNVLSVVQDETEDCFMSPYYGITALDLAASGNRLVADNLIVFGEGIRKYKDDKGKNRLKRFNGAASKLRARRTYGASNFPHKPDSKAFTKPGYWYAMQEHPLWEDSRRAGTTDRYWSFYVRNHFHCLDLATMSGGMNYFKPVIENHGTAPQWPAAKFSKDSHFPELPFGFCERSIAAFYANTESGVRPPDGNVSFYDGSGRVGYIRKPDNPKQFLSVKKPDRPGEKMTSLRDLPPHYRRYLQESWS